MILFCRLFSATLLLIIICTSAPLFAKPAKSDQDYNNAQNRHYGRGGKKQNIKKATALYAKACKGGHYEYCYILAGFY
jgi:TPR repeat protein